MHSFAQAQEAKDSVRQSICRHEWFRGINVSQNSTQYILRIGVAYESDKIRNVIRIAIDRAELAEEEFLVYIADNDFFSRPRTAPKV